MCVFVFVVCSFVCSALHRCVQLAVLYGASVAALARVTHAFVFFVLDARTRDPMGAWQVTLCMVVSGVFLCFTHAHSRTHTSTNTHCPHEESPSKSQRCVFAFASVLLVAVPFVCTFEVHSFVFLFF